MDLLGLFPVLISFVGNSLLEFSQCSLVELLQFHTDRNRSTQPPPETGTYSIHTALLQEQEQVHTAPSRNRNTSTQHPPGTGTDPHSSPPGTGSDPCSSPPGTGTDPPSSPLGTASCAHGLSSPESTQQYVQEKHSVHSLGTPESTPV